MPLERTIIAGNIAPLGWLEAVRKALNLNPYDQPAVELIKKETKKLLI